MHPGSLIWTDDERESRAETLGGEGRTFSSRARQKRDTLRRRHFKPSVLIWEGWFPPILTFKFCYAILLCCYSVFLGILICMFESYYSLSNFVIYFSDFIMPLCILLFSFEFCYSLSNYVMQLSNSIIRSYSPLVQFRILLFPFQFCYSLFQFYFCFSVSNSIIRFRIMFFQIRDLHSLFGLRCPGDQ